MERHPSTITAPNAGSAITEQRAEHRTAAHEEVKLTIPGWAGQPNPMAARVVNVSGQGMCLHTTHPVQCGAQIEIAVASGVILGEVSRCKQETSGYSLGVRIGHR